MKLHLTTAENNYLITGYDENYIGVNNQRYQQSLIVMAQQLDTEWPVSEFAQITEVQMAELANLNPEVVLLGTGQKHQFLHPKIYQALTQKGIPLECMTTAAACRTYNILMSEGRNVLAALII
jgi:uncharacterized protein